MGDQTYQGASNQVVPPILQIALKSGIAGVTGGLSEKFIMKKDTTTSLKCGALYAGSMLIGAFSQEAVVPILTDIGLDVTQNAPLLYFLPPAVSGSVGAAIEQFTPLKTGDGPLLAGLKTLGYSAIGNGLVNLGSMAINKIA
jgi:hypothetical protein